jgi:hypothetical protein
MPAHIRRFDSIARRVAEAAISYFMVMFTISLVVAPLRDFAIASGADPLMALLTQAVVTLLALTFAAGWVVELFDVPRALGSRLAVGFGAVVGVLLFETLAAWLTYEVPPWTYLARLVSRDNLVPNGMWIVAGVLPVLRGRRVETP